MRELQEIIAAWRTRSNQSKFVLAAVVSTEGSAYRRSGARVLISESGQVWGMISGGCIEADLVMTCFERTSNGPCVLEFDASDQSDRFFGFGLGCQGKVKVLLERIIDDGGILAAIESTLKAKRCQNYSFYFDSEARKSWFEIGTANEDSPHFLFSQQISPPLQLTILGIGPDVIPLIEISKNLGWTVCIASTKAQIEEDTRFAEADEIFVIKSGETLSDSYFDNDCFQAVVLMSHSYMVDLNFLKQAALKQVDYLGILGPRKRTILLLKDAQVNLPNVFGPVGLDLGATDPCEIALSIAAEILSVLKGKKDTFGRNRAKHDEGALSITGISVNE